MQTSLYGAVRTVAAGLQEAPFNLSIRHSGYKFGMPYTEQEVTRILRRINTPGSIFVVHGVSPSYLAQAMARIPQVRDALRAKVLEGKILYVSHGAATIYAGVTPQIALGNLPPDLPAQTCLKLVNLHLIPHCQDAAHMARGREIEHRQQIGQLTDDRGNRINVPVVYLKDGSHWVYDQIDIHGNDRPADCYAVLFGQVHARCSIMEPNPPPTP